MSIKINHPIKIMFDEIEIDNYLPSIKFNIDINMKNFNHLLIYSGEIWIDCHVWEQFSKNLSSEESAVLTDMNDSFFINIIKTHGSIVLHGQ